ncbi:MAG TPA: UDP-N-acetylglucosamine 2-epimerase (non-hydrolyzing) [Bryobacteraceae bacterium]|nr:UDP-N-acetylglucosamine 2-epimerase (non-hydrolyzing) [Bryobacteraceae bacterium]
MQRRILFVFGTRPEAIKLCPIIRHMRLHTPELDPRVCVTAQHRDLLDQVLEVFSIRPDHDLNVMLPGQTLFQSTSRIIAALEPVLEAERPEMLFVQGDTTTTLCGALAAFYSGVPVGHVEAGLRTWDLRQPFPEEMNRVLTGRLAALHFAATPWARDNLVREGVDPAAVCVTGNSGIDAVLYIRDALETGAVRPAQLVETDPARRLILVTAHRRESFGEGFDEICHALREIAERPDVEIAYPAHPNPNVRRAVDRWLRDHPRVRILEPLNYVEFVDLMRRAAILVTDSGGIQEEGPSLGKPILVLREKTERPEAVEAGTVLLVGTDRARIVREVSRLLDDPRVYKRMTRVHNPYGDGRASTRISDATLSFLKK